MTADILDGDQRLRQSDVRSSGSPLRQKRRPWATYVFLSLAAVVTVFPFYSMVIISLKPGKAIRMPDALFPTALSFDSYLDALSRADIRRWIFQPAVYS